MRIPRRSALLLAASAAAVSMTLSVPGLGSADPPPNNADVPSVETTAPQPAEEPGAGSTAPAPETADEMYPGPAQPPASDTPSESSSTAPDTETPGSEVPSSESPRESSAPSSSESAKPAPERQSRMAVAAGCQTYPPTTFQVCGRIRDKYNQTGGPLGFLLLPKSNELTNPGNTGKRSEFLGGNIYWSAATDAHPVAHDFLTKWGHYGYETGHMKYPTTDEIVLPGGRRQEFQGAHLYYSPSAGTHNVQGAILAKYQALGAQSGVLGYPTSDERVTPDGVGRFNTFEYGSLYWSPATGAHAVYGPVLEKWAAAGYERSTYGYPTAGAVGLPDGSDRQTFQRGTITVPAANLGSPPWSRPVDKVPGRNYDDALECIGGYDNGALTIFHMTGETLYCRDFSQHIYKRHFGSLEEDEWNDFQTCVAHTLASTERGFSPNEDGMYGRTRYNTYSGVRSYVIVRESNKSVYTAYTNTTGGGDWGGCRQFLIG